LKQKDFFALDTYTPKGRRFQERIALNVRGMRRQGEIRRLQASTDHLFNQPLLSNIEGAEVSAGNCFCLFENTDEIDL
jgi:hypothetical protein